MSLIEKLGVDPDAFKAGLYSYGRGLIAAVSTVLSAYILAIVTGKASVNDLMTKNGALALAGAFIGAAVKYTRDYFRTGTGFGKNAVADEVNTDPVAAPLRIGGDTTFTEPDAQPLDPNAPSTLNE